MGLGGKPYSRGGGGPFSRGGGNNSGGRGGGRNGSNNNRNGGGDNRKAGRDNNRGGDRNNNNNNNRDGGNNDNNNRGGRGGGNNNGGRGGGPRQQGGDVVGILLNLMFEKHFGVMYDASTGVLNLASFHEAPDLQSAKNVIDFGSVAFCKSLVSAIKNSPIGVPRFINLSNNNISTLNNFLRALSDEGMADGILGFSFASNKLKDVGFVGALTRFPNLTELSLQGNPLTDPYYRRTLERRLPSLRVLDGEDIKRLPLGLPFPKHAVLSPMAANVLMFLEQALFTALAENNTQVLMTTYHPNAVFSLSSEDRFQIGCQVNPGTDKSVREDLAKLKHAIKDADANLHNRGAVNRVVKGRTQILAALETALYHRKFLTHHALTPDANVSFLTATPVPVAVATVHGKMMWLPRAAQTETPRAAFFDRTIVLVSDGQTGAWQITSDSVLLRRCTTEENTPLFFADNPSRIEHLSRAFGGVYPPAVFAAMVQVSQNDREYYSLRDSVPKEIIEQCYLLSGSDALKCVLIAKTALTRNCAPQEAFNALSAVDFDVSRL